MRRSAQFALLVVLGLPLGRACAEPQFEELFDLPGITHRHVEGTGDLSGIDDTLGSGVCAADFNRDGWFDLFFVGGSGTSRRYGRTAWWTTHTGHRLYLNDRGRFDDETARFLGEHNVRTRGMGCAVADLDANGWDDIVVTSRGEDRILFNDGGRITRDLVLPGSGGWSTSVAPIDFDGDGHPDLLVGRYIAYQRDQKILELASGFKPSIPPAFDPELYDPIRSVVYRNLGGGDFEEDLLFDADAQSGRTLTLKGTPHGVLVLNQTGQPSQLVRSKLVGPKLAGSKSVSETLGAANDAAFVTVAGRQYLLVNRNIGSGFQLRSPGVPGGVQQDEAWEKGLNTAQVLSKQLWTLLVTDFDNDGDDDVFASAGSAMLGLDTNQVTLPQSNVLFEQRDERFHTVELGEAPRSSRGSVFVDLDNDGRRDLVVANNNDVPTILGNRTETDSDFLGLDLGSHLARFLGAEVCIEALGRCQTVGLHGSFLSQSDTRLLFALPKGSPLPVTIRIEQNGKRRSWRTDRLNAYHRLDEDMQLRQVASGSNEFDMPKDLPRDVLRDVLGDVLGDATGVELVDSLYELEPALLGEIELFERIRASGPATEAFAQAFREHPNRAALGLAHRLLIDRPAAPYATTLIDGIASIEDDASTAVIAPLLASAPADTVCAIAELFVAWYEEEEAAILSKYTAVSDFLHAAETHTDSETTVCLLRAIGASESFRARHTLRGLLRESSDPIVAAAVVRAIGGVRHTSLRSDLEALASVTGSPLVAAEIIVAAKRLDPDLSLDAVLSWFRADLPKTGVLVELVKHPDSVVFNRNSIETQAREAVTDPSASAIRRAELALLINAPVDASAALPTDGPRERAIALASGRQPIDVKTDPQSFAILAAEFPQRLASLDARTVRAVAKDDRKLRTLAPMLTPAQKQHVVDAWLGTSAVRKCIEYDIRASIDYDTAEPWDVACLDAREGDAPRLLRLLDRHADFYTGDPGARRELLRASYSVSQVAGRAVVARLVRKLDAGGAARLAARVAPKDPSFIQRDFDRYWPLLSNSEKLEALGGMATPPLLDRLEQITADPNESMGIRLRAMHQYCTVSGYEPSEVMLELLRT